jgi:trimeric autotransporter adhesin
MKSPPIRILALLCACQLLAACGDDGDTTDSVPASNTGSGGSTGGSGNGSDASFGRIEFSAPTMEVAESGNFTVTLNRSEGSRGRVSATVTTRDGTASSGTDYAALTQTVTFEAEDTAAKTVSIAISADAVVEPDETFTVLVSSPVGGVVIGAGREVLITIRNDDVAAPGKPTAALSAIYKQLRIDWTNTTAATSYRLLKAVNPAGHYAQVGADFTASARSTNIPVIVHREDWRNNRYVIAACNEAGCANSDPVSSAGSSVALIGYLKAPNTARFAEFGARLALSADGNTLVVGAPGEGSAATGFNGNSFYDCDSTPAVNCLNNSGAVFVYTRTNDEWSEPLYIKASNPLELARFGSAVALSADGNTLAVGAIGESSSTTGVGGTPNGAGLASAGAVYLYARSNGIWTGPVFIKASNPDAVDEFGAALALSGDGRTLVVGAPGEDSSSTGVGSVPNEGTPDSGAAYAYAQTPGGSWTGPLYLKASNTGASDDFGEAIALSADGSQLAVGAPREDGGASGIGGTSNEAATDAGAVYLFSRNSAGTWEDPVYVKPTNTQPDGDFGTNVILDGTGSFLVVGSPGEGSPINDCGAPPQTLCVQSGAIYVYTRSQSTWMPSAFIKAADALPFDRFGEIVALSSDASTLAVGAAGESGDALGVNEPAGKSLDSSGASYLFTRNATGWTQTSYIKASNTGRFDRFGTAIGLSSDGNVLAVGAIGESSVANGLNGNPLDDCFGARLNCADLAGAVYLY